MTTPMMKCGHAANATTGPDQRPCCAICARIVEGWDVIDTDAPDLSERRARCAYYGGTIRQYGRGGNECDECRGKQRCQCERPSSSNLAFFEYTPDKPFDNFYCGCHGWD